MRLVADRQSRLDAYLAAEVAGQSRSSIARAIEQGNVTVDGANRKASYRLSPGEVIQFEATEVADSHAIEPVNIPLSVLYEDEYLLVVDKPSGLSTHPSPSSREPTLVHALLARSSSLSDEAGLYRPGIVHRLDKDTSGVLLVAKTNDVHRRLQSAIQRKAIGRVYWAWVRGTPQQERFTIKSYLGRSTRDRKKRAVVSEAAPGARLAVTHCKLSTTSGGVSQLECRLETGRTHQIRVHLGAVGLPILGDLVYGVAYPGLARQALHSARIEFDHPVYGAQIVVEAALPADLTSVDLPFGAAAFPDL
jgi:23S rRNA pseudouridine1911/1915/1917 synthase